MRAPLKLFAVLALISWLVSSAVIVARWDAHADLELLAAQYLLLLPAVVCYLISERGKSQVCAFCGARPAWFLAIFAAIAVLLSQWVKQLTPSGDEASYRFQAAILLTGHVTASAPPRIAASEARYQKDYRFHQHILYRERWFSMYPIGWPAILSLGVALHLDWLVNPALGLLLLWIAHEIAREIWDESTGRLTLFLLVASPFFALNCIGYMSHPSCAVFLAAAALFFFRGLRTGRIRHFALSVLLIAGALIIRPWTAACAGAVLAVASLWALRHRPGRLATFTGAGLLAAAAAVGGLAVYNHALTGSYSRSTYALNRGAGHIAEMSFAPASVLRNAGILTRWSVQETALYAIPFLFLLAGYALISEKQHRREAWILAALFLSLVFGYMPQTEPSGTHFGERFYFETFFAAAILAARGWILLRDRLALPQRAVRMMCILFVCIQVLAFGVFAQRGRERFLPFSAVHHAISHLRLVRAVMFLRSGGGFTAQDLNLNEPGWQWALHFYMPDPGPERRAEFVCALHRNGWAVISYDPAARSARIDELEPAACRP